MITGMGWWRMRVRRAATGTAERDAALWLLAARIRSGGTVGGDKGYDVRAFIAGSARSG